MQGTLLTRSTREGWPSDQPQTTLSVASWLAANIAKKRQLCIQDVGVLFDSGGEPHNATVNYVYCAWLIKWAANYPVGSTVGYMMMICIKWKQLVLDGTGSAWGSACWYLVVLGQCGTVLAMIRFAWKQIDLIELNLEQLQNLSHVMGTV